MSVHKRSVPSVASDSTLSTARTLLAPPDNRARSGEPFPSATSPPLNLLPERCDQSTIGLSLFDCHVSERCRADKPTFDHWCIWLQAARASRSLSYTLPIVDCNRQEEKWRFYFPAARR